jgi:uncharacterized protein
MKVTHHSMSREMFTTLARGTGGPAAVGHLADAQHSKHLILLRGVLDAAGPDDHLATAGYRLLAEIQRREPAAAEAVIRHPAVGAWALRVLQGDRALRAAKPAGLSSVAAAAAIRAGVAAEIEVPVTDGYVTLPSLGATVAAGTTAVVRTSPAEVRLADARVAVDDADPRWSGLRPIRTGSLNVLVDDLDPFRMPAAQDLAPRLTAAEMAEMDNTLRRAWPVLDPATASEIATAVRVIVPLTAPTAGHVSSSSPETFGAVAMSRQPDPYTCAATLVHEAQHLKLSALLDLVPLALPDDGTRYYAPWRPDPRPVSGLLQGTYAFFGVSEFWRRRRLDVTSAEVRYRAETEFARWRAAVARTTTTLLACGGLTTAGHIFVRQMGQVLDAWRCEVVPDEVTANARREAAEHLARWEADNGMRAT